MGRQGWTGDGDRSGGTHGLGFRCCSSSLTTGQALLSRPEHLSALSRPLHGLPRCLSPGHNTCVNLLDAVPFVLLLTQPSPGAGGRCLTPFRATHLFHNRGPSPACLSLICTSPRRPTPHSDHGKPSLAPVLTLACPPCPCQGPGSQLPWENVPGVSRRGEGLGLVAPVTKPGEAEPGFKARQPDSWAQSHGFCASPARPLVVTP